MGGLKVLYIIGGKDDKYGAQKLAIEIIMSIKEKYNVEYCVVTAKDGVINKFCTESGVRNFVSCFKYSAYAPLKNPALDIAKHAIKTVMIDYGNRKAIKEIESKVDVSSFDVIHTNINRDLIGGILSRKYHIPHIWHLQEMYESHFGLKLIHRGQVGWMNSHCDYYIAISDTVAKDWVRQGIDEEKLDIIYNGIDIQNYKFKAKLKTPRIYKLVMAAMIYKEKGQEDLIQALALLSKEERTKVQLDLYGEIKPKYYAYLKKIINDLGIDGLVTFKGYCGSLPDLLSDYDIGFNCSKGEGFGLSTVEYMASGLCPIVSNTGANTELVEDGESGLVYEYGNIEDLRDKIKKIICDKELLNRIKINARLKAMDKFCVENMARKYLAYMEKLWDYDD